MSASLCAKTPKLNDASHFCDWPLLFCSFAYGSYSGEVHGIRQTASCVGASSWDGPVLAPVFTPSSGTARHWEGSPRVDNKRMLLAALRNKTPTPSRLMNCAGYVAYRAYASDTGCSREKNCALCHTNTSGHCQCKSAAIGPDGVS